MAQALLSVQILPKPAQPGDDTHLYVDRAIEIIKSSGVSYRVGPLETTMEGDFDQLLDILKQMNLAMFELGSPSVLSQVKLLVDGGDNASMARLLQKYPDGK
ncbi:thiamine-binding protein [Cohnella nanjingensis]|uniref:Thiamine-binding protein n=1 Tax=Cohnella nanjingensis TaxID=1387779 RepID=A0A7X0VJ11_9BACL|nr:MTH1187 family thiamine-binding protein [Cohnella nanjingensis]MBB6675506.1 thiamine-binding protein [Cohnella nanjingensis]